MGPKQYSLYQFYYYNSRAGLKSLGARGKQEEMGPPSLQPQLSSQIKDYICSCFKILCKCISAIHNSMQTCNSVKTNFPILGGSEFCQKKNY